MAFAPSLACRRCGVAVSRSGARAYRCPQCDDRVVYQGVRLDVE